MPKPYDSHDKYMQRAKKEGYRARSIYKLEELDEKFNLIRPGMVIFDLAAAPGSWLQYISEKIGSKGLVLGIDLLPIKWVASNIKTVQGDINDFESLMDHLNFAINNPDLILSDIAPNTSGIPGVDHYKSIELNKTIFEIAKQYLKPRGNLVMKVFDGGELHLFLRDLKDYFRDVKALKVLASRDRSKELYIICRGKNG